MDEVTLYAPDGRSVVIRSAVEATNLRTSGYRDEPPAVVAVETPAGEPNLQFDPSEHTVDEVKAFLAEHPDLTDSVVAAEQAGKNRASITGGAGA